MQLLPGNFGRLGPRYKGREAVFIAKRETKKVFDDFFDTMPPEVQRKCRAQVDRSEVYAYEIQQGKQIFDMDVDELFGLVESFGNRNTKGSGSFRISYGSYDQIASMYRQIWNFYIDHVDVIKNPWNDGRMRGSAAAARIAASKKRFTLNDVENAIAQMYREYPDDSYTPKYVECLLRLFYSGFADSQEIAALKEDMIRPDTLEVCLPGRTVHLSDRCFALLQYVHDLEEIETRRGLFKAVPYQGGYFKFIVRAKSADDIQKKSLAQVGAILVRKITTTVRQEDGSPLSYRMVYLLGFYEYVVSKAGEVRTEELIRSVRNSGDAQELMTYVSDYGLNAENVSYVKKLLRPFI